MDLKDGRPKRICIILRDSSAHWQEKDDEVFDAALQLINANESIQLPYRFMAKELWGTVNFFVLDIHNDDYNFDTAHIEGCNDLPVITVRFSKKKETARMEGLPMQARVNQQLRELHDNEGFGSKPPFFVYHTERRVPTYLTPRSAIHRHQRDPA